MSSTQEQTGYYEVRTRCAVAVVYEDVAARDAAIELCDTLVGKFAGDLEFDLTWWRFDYLTEPMIAQEAGEAVAKADMILVVMDHPDGFPWEVRAWLDHWLGKRRSAAGALAVLKMPGTVDYPYQDAWFRSVARGANLDFLSFPGQGGMSDAANRLRDGWAGAEMAAPDDFPESRYHSSDWGINE